MKLHSARTYCTRFYLVDVRQNTYYQMHFWGESETRRLRLITKIVLVIFFSSFSLKLESIETSSLKFSTLFDIFNILWNILKELGAIYIINNGINYGQIRLYGCKVVFYIHTEQQICLNRLKEEENFLSELALLFARLSRPPWGHSSGGLSSYTQGRCPSPNYENGF